MFRFFGEAFELRDIWYALTGRPRALLHFIIDRLLWRWF